ncbi:MAG: hypothetical protein QNJ14_00910 [Woeseiaceae bacterium]|nr:hypothetical protein [Woeseiaceae bacterium]
MRRGWHILAILLALVAGVITLLWPGPSDEPEVTLPESPPPMSSGQEVIPPVEETANTPREDTAASASELTERAINARAVGDIETAISLFEQAISADPTDTVALSNYGRLLTLTFSLERAVEVLEAARDLRPADAQAWLDLATVYERAQLFTDSREAQAMAQSLVGANAITRDEMGRFLVAGTKLD